MKKRILSITLATVLMLTACTPAEEKNNETLKSTQTAISQATTPTGTDAALESTAEQLLLPTATAESGQSDISSAVPVTTGSENEISATVSQNAADETPKTSSEASTSTTTKNPTVTATANTTATAKPTVSATQATENPISTSKPQITSSTTHTASTATKKPTVTATTKATATAKATAGRTTATAKATATVKATATTKATSTVKPAKTPTPTQKTVTYRFEPSTINIYAGQVDSPSVAIYDSNGNKITDWSIFKEVSVSNVNVGYINLIGTELISAKTVGNGGRIGSSVVTMKHIASGQTFSITIKATKDPKYLAYYVPYDIDAIQKDLKEYVESHNGIWNYLATPETSGYYPGHLDFGSEGSVGEKIYNMFISGLYSPVRASLANGNIPSLDDWNNMDLYVHWELTSGVKGTSSAKYTIRWLYGSSVGPGWDVR